MLLKTRLIFLTIIGCVLLASALIMNEVYNQEKILKTFQEDTLNGLQELWEEVVKNDAELLSKEAELIAKNIHFLPELKTGNQQKIDAKLLDIVGTKFKSDPLHWIAIFNHRGSLIYFSENLNLSNNFIQRRQILSLFKKHSQQPSGLFEDIAGERSVIGGHFVLKDQAPSFVVLNGYYVPYLINEMALASNDKVALLNLNGEVLHQTYDIPHASFDLKTFVNKKIFELKEIGSNIFHVYSWPLKLENHDVFGQMLLLANAADLHHQTRNALMISIVIGVLLTCFIILVLSFMLRRALSPLGVAIDILKALTKGDTSVKAIEYRKDDEVGSVIHATEALRKQTIEVHNLQEQQKDLVKIKEQLNIAKSIQASFLTEEPLVTEAFQIAGFMRAATEVGGDFYDYFKTEDNKLVIIIGDVSGKGVPAAMFMATTLSYLKAHLKAGLSVTEALAKTNNLLIEKNSYQFFVTVFVCVINLKNNVMTYSNGGHNPPLLMSKTGDLKPLAMTGDMALGVMPNLEYKDKTHKLYPDDTLLLYTDGLTEAINIKHEQYGEDQLSQFFQSGQSLAPQHYLEYIVRDIDLFSGAVDQFDDMTAVILAIDPGISTEITLAVPMNVEQALDALSGFVKRHVRFFEPFAHKLTHIEMVLEELIVNTIQYGANQVQYKNTVMQLNFKCFKNAHLIVTLTDTAEPFDPTEKAKPDLDEVLAKREIGGLGIHLTRELSDEFKYNYEDGVNKVTLSFLK